MINELLRIGFYYIEVGLSRPFYVLLPALVTLFAGAYLIFSMPRSYQSEALMLMQFQQMPTTLVSPTVSNDRMQFIEQRILSRKNLLVLADNHHLFPDLAPTVEKSRLASLVRSQINLNVQVAERPDASANNGSVQISFRYSDPKVAAEVVSDLVSQIIEENRRMRLSRASETVRFLKGEVETIAQRFKQRSDVWSKYFEENSAAHPARIPALMIELQSKEQELAVLDRTILTLTEEIRVYEAQLRSGQDRSGPTATLAIQLRAAEAELATKSRALSNAHPDIRGLRQQVEELKKQIAANQEADVHPNMQSDPIQTSLPPELILAAERLSAARPQRTQATSQRIEFIRRIEELRTIISKAPEVLAQTTAHETEKASLQRSMDDMQAKLDAARLGERLEVGDGVSQIEVIEEPEVPIYSVGPSRKYLALGVCLAATAVAAAIIFMIHLFDRTIRGTFDLADALAGETLVVIPGWMPKKRVARAFRDSMLTRAGPA